MSYTWEEIKNDWLAGADISTSQAKIINSFESVERVFGRSYVESFRLHHGTVMRGTMPTHSVIDFGEKLALLDSIKNSSKLIHKLKTHDRSAFAELSAIYLLHGYFTECEYEPEIKLKTKRNEKIKYPDFRLKYSNNQWLYIEVTQPDTSEKHAHLELRREPFFSLVTIEKPFALEVYLRREPTDSELEMLVARCKELCLDKNNFVEEVDGLGFIKIDHVSSQTITPTVFPGEPPRSMLGKARFMGGGGQPFRHVTVRIAYSDERAEEFLRKEAKQLPIDAPGIIMIDVARATGGPKIWGPLITRRLQPNINTRIGGICMFHAGHEPPEGDLIHRATYLQNPHAKQSVPTWVSEAMNKFPEWKL